MVTVGLCGGSGTGKSTAQAAFAKHGIPALDTDLLYHRMVDAPSSLSTAIIAEFGGDVAHPDGSVNRAALAELVFADGEVGQLRRRILNAMTHTAILEECRRWLLEKRASGAYAAVINAPLLFESQFDKECDLTVALLAPDALRLERIMARDGIGKEMAERRIAAQHSNEALTKMADCCIWNDCTLDEFEKKIADLVHMIKKMSEDTENE